MLKKMTGVVCSFALLASSAFAADPKVPHNKKIAGAKSSSPAVAVQQITRDNCICLAEPMFSIANDKARAFWAQVDDLAEVMAKKGLGAVDQSEEGRERFRNAIVHMAGATPFVEALNNITQRTSFDSIMRHCSGSETESRVFMGVLTKSYNILSEAQEETRPYIALEHLKGIVLSSDDAGIEKIKSRKAAVTTILEVSDIVTAASDINTAIREKVEKWSKQEKENYAKKFGADALIPPTTGHFLLGLEALGCQGTFFNTHRILENFSSVASLEKRCDDPKTNIQTLSDFRAAANDVVKTYNAENPREKGVTTIMGVAARLEMR